MKLIFEFGESIIPPKEGSCNNGSSSNIVPLNGEQKLALTQLVTCSSFILISLSEGKLNITRHAISHEVGDLNIGMDIAKKNLLETCINADKQ